jgi:hypothetical protein
MLSMRITYKHSTYCHPSPEPMLQSLTDQEYAAARPEDNEFEPMTTENLL